MSTSIAANPAYRSQPTARSKAKPDRTIFGTSLDNFDRCKALLGNNKVLKHSERLFDSKLETAWKNRGTSSLELEAGAGWDLKKYYQRVNRTSTASTSTTQASKRSKKSTTSNSVRSKASRSRKSTASTVRQRTSTSSIENQRPRIMNLENNQRPPGGGVGNPLPKYRMKPGHRNYMQITSMKITETGAKDLMNSKPVNKVGLGETLQYNYQEHKTPDTPKVYGCHGHVLQQGQKFNSDTTNGDVTAPGGFYRLPKANRDINERYEWKHNRYTERTIAHKRGDDEDPLEIPANIRHKFRRYGGDQILSDNIKEVQHVLNNKEYLNYTGIVPKRTAVKELNHPVDPPPKYFSRASDKLKHDSLFDGQHMYIT